MTFLCPTCRTATMTSGHLETGLQTEQCATCHGYWITSARYFSYLEQAQATPLAPPPPAATEPSGMKMCPACRKFMHYYPVGHGLSFGIDKCNTCGGVWLDAGEWEALVQATFHLHLHAISSDAWQEQVQQQVRTAHEEAAMERRLGHEDYARLVEVARWMGQHPHRAEILAYLQRPDEPR